MALESTGPVTSTHYEVEAWQDYLGTKQWRRMAMPEFATREEADAFRAIPDGPISRMKTRTVKVVQIRTALH